MNNKEKDNPYVYAYIINKKENEIKMNKQKILEAMKTLKNQQKEITEKMEWLQKKIEEENNKKEWWIPKEKDLIWIINSEGIPSMDIYYNYDKISNNIIENLNYYKTEEEAERVAFEQLLHRKLQRFAFENNEEEIDWKSRANKYSIIYNNFNNELAVEIYISFQNLGAISFLSKEVAEKAIEEFRDDLIRYFTSNK